MSGTKILISQPQPTNHSPFFDLEKKYNVDLEFRKFFQIAPVTSKEIRRQKINFEEITAVIFTSRVAADHFFKALNQIRMSVPDKMKYFCSNETIAQYLNKYIVYRKRKIFIANGQIDNLISLITKNPDEKYLLPVGDNSQNSLYNRLKRKKINVSKAILYKIVSADIKDMKLDHDIVVLFSPSGVKALIENFPDVKSSNIKIAVSGPSTEKAATKAGLKVSFKAPTTEYTSIIMALEDFLRNGKQN